VMGRMPSPDSNVVSGARSGPHLCLVVPHGSRRPGPLARRFDGSVQPDAIGAVWCGDPAMQPFADEVVWWEPAADEGDWHRILVASSPLVAEWWRALGVVERLLDEGASSVTIMWTGAVAVLGDVSALWSDVNGMRFVPRVVGPLPADGLVPDDRALLEAGRFSTHVATFARQSIAAVEWLRRQLADRSWDSSSGAPLGRLLEMATALFDHDECTDPRLGVGSFRWQTSTPVLLDVEGYRPDTPWVLDARESRAARITVVGHPDRVRALDEAADQLAGERRDLVIPGGVTVDDVMRRAVRAADGSPSPWASSHAFRQWLSERYWARLHAERRDLSAAFPQPAGHDADAFGTWTRRAVLDDRAALLLPPIEPASHRFQVAPSLRSDGFNLVGYLRHDLGLGDVARRIAASAAAANVPVSLLAHTRTGSPLAESPVPVADHFEFATTLAVVNADQFGMLLDDHPELAASSTTIGYWFWELEHVPRSMRDAFAMVDEVWVGSRFVAEAIGADAPRPVRHVPIPVQCPVPSARGRASFERLAPFADRFVFVVVFDHFSVTARKNPIGAIDAFCRAFQPDEGPLLVVKSMNGARRWPQHQQVVARAEGRPDIVIWDEHLDRDDHLALIASADALVSLHRSEGLGLHLAEAMWLGTPCIATRYSGNLDFMDDDCAALIDASMIAVTDGEGVYPASAHWADPDIEQAAAAMRRMVDDPAWRARLVEGGRAKMEAQPSLADTGRRIAELLDLRIGR
jgi:hypothetical protein